MSRNTFGLDFLVGILMIALSLVGCATPSATNPQQPNPPQNETQNTYPILTHTGIVGKWEIDRNKPSSNRRRLTFQDGLVIQFVYWGGRGLAVGEKIKLDYRYDPDAHGMVAISFADVK